VTSVKVKEKQRLATLFIVSQGVVVKEVPRHEI
jgi:hypothetical protein